MNLEDQVCQLILAKKLKALGIKQESLFYYVNDELIKFGQTSERNEQVSAFTSSELGEIIGSKCNEWAQGYHDCYSQWAFHWGNRGAGSMIDGIGKVAYSTQESEVNARAELLIHILDPENYPLTTGLEGVQ